MLKKSTSIRRPLFGLNQINQIDQKNHMDQTDRVCATRGDYRNLTPVSIVYPRLLEENYQVLKGPQSRWMNFARG